MQHVVSCLASQLMPWESARSLEAKQMKQKQRLHAGCQGPAPQQADCNSWQCLQHAHNPSKSAQMHQEMLCILSLSMWSTPHASTLHTTMPAAHLGRVKGQLLSEGQDGFQGGSHHAAGLVLPIQSPTQCSLQLG